MSEEVYECASVWCTNTFTRHNTGNARLYCCEQCRMKHNRAMRKARAGSAPCGYRPHEAFTCKYAAKYEVMVFRTHGPAFELACVRHLYWAVERTLLGTKAVVRVLERRGYEGFPVSPAVPSPAAAPAIDGAGGKVPRYPVAPSRSRARVPA